MYKNIVVLDYLHNVLPLGQGCIIPYYRIFAIFYVFNSLTFDIGSIYGKQGEF
mgnify:CR=1